MSFNFMAAVTICSDFGDPLPPKKIKSVTLSIVSPCICHEVMGPDAAECHEVEGDRVSL